MHADGCDDLITIVSTESCPGRFPSQCDLLHNILSRPVTYLGSHSEKFKSPE